VEKENLTRENLTRVNLTRVNLTRVNPAREKRKHVDKQIIYNYLES
jgi:uncharacterized protein YjbI with pentapeptide repeats